MKGSLKYILILFFAVIFFGCKKENSKPSVDYLYSYFPMAEGYSLVYNVTEINIDDTMDIFDTLRYQLKERFDSLYYDNSGNPAWRLERYKRNDSSQNWIISDVWEAQVINNQLQIVEENQRFVKVVFPPEVGMHWDGNTFNTIGRQEYEVTDLNVPGNVNQYHFDSTLTITLDNRESLINKYYTINQYAKHAGLINKTVISIDYANIIPGVPIEQRIVRGHLYYQTLIDYFNE